MQRREFITLLGGMAAWPIAVRAHRVAHRAAGLDIQFAATQDDVAGVGF